MKIRFSLVALAFVLFIISDSRAEDTAHYIDVGQAESILLEFKTAAILIDAGGEDTGDTRDRDHLIDYLNRFFQRRRDLRENTGAQRGILYSLIISHPHIDHTRHLMAVMDSFKVLNLVEGGQKGNSIGLKLLNKARASVQANHILYNVIKDSEIGKSGYTTAHLRKLKNSASKVDVRFLAGARGCKNENIDSLVVLVRYREATYLFVGDAETESEPMCRAEIAELVDFYKVNGLLDVDVYKVGHHGSHNGTSKALMRAMTAEISVISAGDLDTRDPGGFHAFQFGHPRQKAFLLLQEFTTGERGRKRIYAMDAAGIPPPNSNRPPGKPVFREITEAVYCTCWDEDIRVTTNEDGTKFVVETGPMG